MPDKTRDLANAIVAAVAASGLGYDETVKALGIVRAGLSRQSTSTTDWRRDRVAQGPVGSGKKTDAMREDMKSKPKRR